jgi:RimJ/RimL family protein N-acetyltransferase
VYFELQPILEGPLLRLRPLVPGDFDALLEAARDPGIWAQHPEPDRYTLPVFQRFFQGALDSKGAFVILDKKSWATIGSSRYYDLRPDEKQVEIGWTFLKREYWRGTYNRELKGLMLNHAFRFVDRVVFVIGPNNLRSQKAVEKLGARFEREERRPELRRVYLLEKKIWEASCQGADIR